MASNAFVLKSLELKNWKAFKEVTLNLKEEGLTGIVGTNGSGKSSFVDAIFWCLYGYQPKGNTKGALRMRKSDVVKEETLVQVTFTHAGQTIEVFRRMKGKNHDVSAGVFLDGEKVTFDTGSTAERWVTNRLGMDINGFKTAVIVPQKELDNLVDNLPSKRREEIERLAGIEEMNTAVQKARAEETDLSKQIKIMPGSVEEVEEASQFHQSVQNELSLVEENLQNSAVAEDETRAAVEESQNSAKESKAKLDTGSELYNQLVNLRNRRDSVKQQIDSLESQKSESTKDISDVDVSQHSTLQEKYREITRSINELNSHFNEQESFQNEKKGDLQRTLSSKEKVDKQVSTLENEIKEFHDHLAKFTSLKSLQNEEESLIPEKESLQSEIGQLSSRVEDFDERIQSLESVKDNAHCPTCQSALDNPEVLIESMTYSRDSFSASLTEKRELFLSKEKRIYDINLEIRERERIEYQVAPKQQELSKLLSESDSTQETIDSLTKEVSELEALDKESHQNKIDELENQRRNVVTQGERIKQAIQIIERIEKLDSQISELKEESELAQPKLQEIEADMEKIGNLDYLRELVQKNDTNLDFLRSKHGRLFADMKSFESEQSKLKERVSNAKDNLERMETMAASKSKAMATLEDRAAVTDLLDEYRKERIARIAPELSSTATEIISPMTNGRFIEVQMNNDFSTDVVKDDDEVYSVSSLSGGEKSIVALALRIAISSLVSGDNAGLLWLDEVLPAQDASRREAVLGVIKDLPIQQIVMINHAHEAEDVVDSVIRVMYDQSGSTIEEE